MNRNQKTVILKLTKALSNEEYKKLYFELRRQIWSGIMVLPPDIEFIGVCGDDDAVAIISKEKEDLQTVIVSADTDKEVR